MLTLLLYSSIIYTVASIIKNGGNKKMKVEKIYVANNGDIFFKHNSLYKERTQEEITELMKSANEAYKNHSVDIIICKAVECEEPVQHISYRLPDGEFIGEAGMHVTQGFSVFQNKIYLKKVSEKTVSNDLGYMVTNDLISIAEYAEIHGVKPDTVRQKILRGNLEAVKIGRNWVIGRDVPYTDNRKK